MERFIKGDIVVIPFPFSDLSQSKRRPALVIAELEGDENHHVGEIDIIHVERTAFWAKKHGFSHAHLTNFSNPLQV